MSTSFGSGEAMSNPNEKTRNRQTVILLVGVGGILILAFAGMFLFRTRIAWPTSS